MGETKYTSCQVNDIIVGSNKGCEETIKQTEGQFILGRAGWGILDRMVEKGIPEELTFEQRPE